jgi:dihydroorotase
MITIKNIRTLDEQITDLHISSTKEHVLEGEGRLLLPGLIDPHISFGSPNRENWAFAVESAIRGGITGALDIPSQDLPCENKKDLEQKRFLVNKHLSDLKIPLDYSMYFKANSENVEEIGLAKELVMGSLILFTPDHHELDDKTWDRIFQIAAWEDLPITINSRNENSWREARFRRPDETLLEKAIYYAEKQNTRLYVLNVATRDELDLIEQARSRSILIYAETTPQHLFPQNASQAHFLWEALTSGKIETIGSGYHVDEQDQERLLWQGGNFDFLNPLFLLPMLLTACHEGKITIEHVVRLTRANLYDIFELEKENEGVILVDLEDEQLVRRVHKNSSINMNLKGWPVYTILKGQIFAFSKGGYHLTPIE